MLFSLGHGMTQYNSTVMLLSYSLALVLLTEILFLLTELDELLQNLKKSM